MCDGCSAHNYASRDACFRCHQPKPHGAGLAGDGSGVPSSLQASGPPADMRDGDWLCVDCNGHNYASRDACFKCHAPRPAGTGEPKRRKFA